MSCSGEENTYISHLIECAISENTDQEILQLPGTPFTGPDSIQENQIIQVNSGPNPIVIQRHFGANDPFCLGSDSDISPQQIFECIDVSQDYSHFIVQKSYTSIVNASSENPPEWELVEISDDEESLINERRKAENNYFQQFMSKERGRSLSDQSNLISDKNGSFVRRIINQVTSGEYDIPNSNQIGSSGRKAHSKTFLKPSKKTAPRVKISKLVDKAKENGQIKVKLVSNRTRSVSGQKIDGSNDSQVAAQIELREIQENTYLKDFLDLCNKKEKETDNNKESERKSKKRIHQSNGERSDDFIERIKDKTSFNIEEDVESFQNSTGECPSSDEGCYNTLLFCGYCGLAQINSAALDQHLETEHTEIETNEASHEWENEYWRLTKELVEEQRKRKLERGKEPEENLTEEAYNGTGFTHEQTLDEKRSRKCRQERDKRYIKTRQARGRSRMSNKEKEKSCVDDVNDKSGSPNINKTEDSKPDENDSDDDIEIIEPTIELVVIDSSDDEEENVGENKGNNSPGSHSITRTPGKIVTMQNEKISTSNTLFKACSVNLSRMKIDEFDKTNENFNCNSKLKKSKVPKVNLGNIGNKDCKVILDRVMLTDEQLSHSRSNQKDTNLRNKKQLTPIHSECKIKTPQCSVSLEKLSPQNFGQTDMNNIIKYLISCETQNKDKLLMQKYGIKDVSVSVSKAPTISEEVSKFFSREHNFTKLNDSFSEFSSRSAPSFKPDDQISLVSNRSVSPQPSTSSGHSYIPRKRTARKSAKDNTMKRGHTQMEPKVILQNLSSIDIALLKNPNSSYRKSNWLNMFNEESSDSDDNSNNKIPIKSLLDNINEGVTENIVDLPSPKKGKGKAICRKNQRPYSKTDKSGTNLLTGTIKQELADVNLLKKFGITRSIVVLKDKKSKDIDKHWDKVTKNRIEKEDCNVIKDGTCKDIVHGKGKGKRKFDENKRFVRKDPVSSKKRNKSVVESKKFVRKMPVYSPTALSLIRSARFKKGVKNSINLRGSQSKDSRMHSLESKKNQKKPEKEIPSKVYKAKTLKRSSKSVSDIRKNIKGKQILNINKKAQHISVRSRKSHEGISNLDLCKPFSINLTSIDKKNVMSANLVCGKLTNTVPVKEDVCKSETIDSEIEFSSCVRENLSMKTDSEQKPVSLNSCKKKESNDSSKDKMDDHEIRSIDNAQGVEKCMEKEADSTTNTEVGGDTRQNDEDVVVDNIKMEIGNENCNNNTESVDVKSRKKENDDNGNVIHKRKSEEDLIGSPSKWRKLSIGKKDEDGDLDSTENSNIQLTGDCSSAPETKNPDKIPHGLRKVKVIDKKQEDEEEKYDDCETEHLRKSKNPESLLVGKGELVKESKGKACSDIRESINKIAHDVATERQNSESLQTDKRGFFEGTHSEEIVNDAINGCRFDSTKSVSEGKVEGKNSPVYDTDSNESKKDNIVATNETIADYSGFVFQVGKDENTIEHFDDNLDLSQTKLVAPAIMHDQSLKSNQYKNDNVKDIVVMEISKSHEHEGICKHIKETSEIGLISRDKQSEHITSGNKRILVITDAITVLNDMGNAIESIDKENEKQDSEETINSERTENCVEDSVGKKLSSSEQEIELSSSDRDCPSNRIEVMDNQTKDVVGTCFIHQEKGDSPIQNSR